jgi:alkylhydroperoxidase/carboxymuconolactone decarboxylase family protein YurZ
MARLPKPYQNFQKKYSQVWTAYDELGAAVHSAGPLDEKTRELVKLALAVGAQLEGATHRRERRRNSAGCSVSNSHHRLSAHDGGDASSRST